MKKFLFVALILTVVFTACNRKAFVKKLVGTWKFESYTFEGKDKTLHHDTTYREYVFDITEDDRYNIKYFEYQMTEDSLVLSDTLGFDSAVMAYIIQKDTLRYIDTIIKPRSEFGTWDLINSEEDLQLRSDSDLTNPRIYRILELTKNNLKLRKGNEEFEYTK